MELTNVNLCERNIPFKPGATLPFRIVEGIPKIAGQTIESFLIKKDENDTVYLVDSFNNDTLFHFYGNTGQEIIEQLFEYGLLKDDGRSIRHHISYTQNSIQAHGT